MIESSVHRQLFSAAAFAECCRTEEKSSVALCPLMRLYVCSIWYEGRCLCPKNSPKAAFAVAMPKRVSPPSLFLFILGVEYQHHHHLLRAFIMRRTSSRRRLICGAPWRNFGAFLWNHCNKCGRISSCNKKANAHIQIRNISVLKSTLNWNAWHETITYCRARRQ